MEKIIREKPYSNDHVGDFIVLPDFLEDAECMAQFLVIGKVLVIRKGHS